MPSPEPSTAISGYDLVTWILDHPRGGVQSLIDLAGGGETDWLEFKAAMVGRPQDRKNPKEDASDGHWNVAEAVLALANTRGGAVLVGVDDAGKVVGLEAGDPRKIIELKGHEAYRRMEIHDRIHPPSGPCKWKLCTDKTWELEHPWPDNQFVVRAAKCQDQDIAVIVVRPVPDGQHCLTALQNGEERLLRRREGNIGEVYGLRGRHAIAEAEQTRHAAGEDLLALWERFRRHVEEGESDNEDLESAISAWHCSFRKNSVDLLTTFTPLDAEEQFSANEDLEIPVPREVFEPEAEELLPDYLREDYADAFADDDDQTNDGELEDDDHEVEAIMRPARRGGLFSLLTEEPRAVVLGEPGGGKTTCLRRLTLETLEAYRPGGIVALYVPLSRWKAAGGLWSLVRRCTGLSAGQVERLILAGRCGLFLDALNECPDALRESALNALKDLLLQFRDLPVVISARTPDTTAALRLPTFTVEPLSEPQRIAFLKAYLKDTVQAEQLLERIHAQPGGENLASNPLLLRMIVEVARRDGDLPHGRAGLYREWISNWYARELKKAKRAGDPLPWSSTDTLRGLAAIAFAARKQGLRIADDELALDSLAGVVDDPVRFLERMTQGPLIIREEGRLQFRHETFQEYLCAEALLADPIALDVIGPEGYGTWGMPIAYAAELQDPLPAELMAATWKISSWLAAALADPKDPRPPLSDTIEPLIQWETTGIAPETTALTQFLGKKWNRKWYLSDGPLQYAIGNAAPRRQRWHEFELSQLRKAGDPAHALRVVRRSLTLPKLWLVKDREYARLPLILWAGRTSPDLAGKLIEAGLMKLEDFIGERQRWAAQATPEQAAAWVKAGLMNLEDFAGERQRWPAQVTRKQAAALVKAGITTWNDFGGNRLKSNTRGDPYTTTSLPQSGEWTAPDTKALMDFELRCETDEILRNMEFRGTLILSKMDFGFIQTTVFTDNIFCPRWVWPPNGPSMALGQELRFKVRLRFRKNKGIWGYVAASVIEILSAASSTANVVQ